jgi:anti-anti-sigma factor
LHHRTSQKENAVDLLTVAVEAAGGRVVVQLRGEADLSVVPLLVEGLREAAAASDAVEVDLTDVDFFDCSCLSVLSDFRAAQQAAGRDCRLVGVSPAVRRLLALTGREDLLAC